MPVVHRKSRVVAIALVAVFAALSARAQNTTGEHPRSHGMDVELPASTNSVATPLADRADAVILSVTRKGQFFLGKSRVGPGVMVLADRLKDRLANHIVKTVFLNADARVRYQMIALAFNRMRAAGADVCDLLTLTSNPQPAPQATAMGLEVLLPPHSPTQTSLDGVPIVVQVLKGAGGVRWKINREDVSDLRELTAHLQSILRTRAERVVFVKADESVTFRDLVEAIGAIYASTADRVAMIIPAVVFEKADEVP